MAVSSNFDLNVSAAELNAAHEEPTITVGSNLYRGRLLSIEEWLPFFERLEVLESARLADAEAGRPTAMRPYVRLYVDYLYTVFPRARFKFWAPDPVAAIREMPGEGLREAFESFFSHQARVLGARRESLETPSGTDSPSRTDVIVPPRVAA